MASAWVQSAPLPSRLGWPGAFVQVAAPYQYLLEQEGLSEPEHFLDLPGVIVCGHPNRHVARVVLSSGLTAFLKREHSVPWRDRLVNAWDGFGLVSRSCREAQMLRDLRQAGIACPEVIAAGEDGQGRAFLLLREISGARELRAYLCAQSDSGAKSSRRLAGSLGAALARLHQAGFDHRDLCAKHVLVGEDGETIYFLDWQRSSRHPTLDWKRRSRALAALAVTIAEELASPRDRLACLVSYLRCCAFGPGGGVPGLRQTILQVLHYRQRLRRCRHLREQCQTPAPAGQGLLWLDGEALCVTPEFHAALNGRVPAWLGCAAMPGAPRNHVRRTVVSVPGARQAVLVRRQSSRPLHALWTWLRWRPRIAPELRQAGLLFRLERYGIGVPRLLAVGQRHHGPWRTTSFLLTEPLPDTVPLRDWLATWTRRPSWTAECEQRWAVLRAAGQLLRRLRDAGCGLDLDARTWPLFVQTRPAEVPTVVLGALDALDRHDRAAMERRQFTALCHLLTQAGGSRTDGLRLLLSYLGLARLTPAAKEWIRTGVAR